MGRHYHRQTILWRKPHDVSWEGRRETDVRQTEQLHQQALGADGETALRWHAVFEDFQVVVEWLLGQTRFLQRRDVVLIVMQTLPTCHQFSAPKDEVEGV